MWVALLKFKIMRRKINIEHAYEWIQNHMPFGETGRDDVNEFAAWFLFTQCNVLPVYNLQRASHGRAEYFGVIGFISFTDERDIDAETIWHLTNWSCWQYNDNEECDAEPREIEADGLKYTRMDNDLGYTNDDVVFFDGDKWQAALPSGWIDFETLEAAEDYLRHNATTYIRK